MQAFEYKLVTVSSADLKKEDYQSELSHQFNEWGSLGWELVKMEPVLKPSIWNTGSRTEGFLAVFKRPKS